MASAQVSSEITPLVILLRLMHAVRARFGELLISSDLLRLLSPCRFMLAFYPEILHHSNVLNMSTTSGAALIVDGMQAKIICTENQNLHYCSSVPELRLLKPSLDNVYNP